MAKRNKNKKKNGKRPKPARRPAAKKTKRRAPPRKKKPAAKRAAPKKRVAKRKPAKPRKAVVRRPGKRIEKRSPSEGGRIVPVKLSPREAAFSLDIPKDVRIALEGHDVIETFATLPPGKRRQLVGRVDSSKRVDERVRRIEELVDKMRRQRYMDTGI